MSDWTDIRDTTIGVVAPTTVFGPLGTPYSIQAGVDSPVWENLGLEPDWDEARDSSAFNPININSLFGGVKYDPETRTFTSSLNPKLQAITADLMSRLGNIDPASEYRMMRQMAAPGMEQERLNMENRLFSQGRLGASSAYGTGGEMRSLFDSQQQRDMMMQMQSIENSRNERANLLKQILGLQDIENSLFSNSGTMSGYSNQSQRDQANIDLQESTWKSNMLWNIFGGLVSGGASR